MSTFINYMLDSLIQHNKYLKLISVETNIIAVTLLQAEDKSHFCSDILK